MSIADTLNAAKAEADKAAPAPTGTAVAEATPAVPGKRMSRADFQNNAAGGVTTYLKVSEHGLTVGKEATKLVESFKATIAMRDLKYCNQVRFGKPAQYFKTYDNVTTAGTGKPWQKTLETAKSFDSGPQTNPFMTAEIVFVASEDIKSIKQEVVAPAGTKLGYTPPYTGVDNFNKFTKDVEDAGIDPDTGVVELTVGYEAKAKNGNNWGNVTFTLIGEAKAA